MHRILLGGFRFVYKPFLSMVKFLFLAQFPVDLPHQPVMHSLELFLWCNLIHDAINRSTFLHFIILIFWEFFTLVLADGFSLEFEWQQVFSSLQDSSQYYSRS